jgi:hypothetical protein
MESEIECDAMAKELFASSDYINRVVGLICMCVISYMSWILIHFINYRNVGFGHTSSLTSVVQIMFEKHCFFIR